MWMQTWLILEMLQQADHLLFVTVAQVCKDDINVKLLLLNCQFIVFVPHNTFYYFMGIYSCVFVISEKLDRTVTLALCGLGGGLRFLDF